MRKLESVIAQFVGDLLQTIGEATVDDLRELFAGRPESEKVLEARAEFSAPTLAGPPGRPGLPPRAARAPAREPRRSIGSTSAESLPLASVAEITDPESLLSLGRSSESSGLNGTSFPSGSAPPSGAPPYGTPPYGAAPSSGEATRAPSRSRARALLDVGEHAAGSEGHAEPDASPASSIRPLGNGATVKLSDNETLARVSSSGVVIRRKKRGQG